MQSSEVLLKPIYTEKSLRLASKGCYTFEVSLEATKGQIKKAIKDLFQVDAQTVKTLTIKGELKRTGRRRNLVKQSDLKKALVSLKGDQKINVFEQEETKEAK